MKRILQFLGGFLVIILPRLAWAEGAGGSYQGIASIYYDLIAVLLIYGVYETFSAKMSPSTLAPSLPSGRILWFQMFNGESYGVMGSTGEKSADGATPSADSPQFMSDRENTIFNTPRRGDYYPPLLEQNLFLVSSTASHRYGRSFLQNFKTNQME